MNMNISFTSLNLRGNLYPSFFYRREVWLRVSAGIFGKKKLVVMITLLEPLLNTMMSLI